MPKKEPLTRPMPPCKVCGAIRIEDRYTRTDFSGTWRNYSERPHDCIACPKCGERRWSAWSDLAGTCGIVCQKCNHKRITARGSESQRRKARLMLAGLNRALSGAR